MKAGGQGQLELDLGGKIQFPPYMYEMQVTVVMYIMCMLNFLHRIPVTVHFADGTKAKVNLSPAETTSDLLEKEEVKENLTSSASYLWMVDNHGNGK